MPAYQIILAFVFAGALAALAVICYRVGIRSDTPADNGTPATEADE